MKTIGILKNIYNALMRLYVLNRFTYDVMRKELRQRGLHDGYGQAIIKCGIVQRDINGKLPINLKIVPATITIDHVICAFKQMTTLNGKSLTKRTIIYKELLAYIGEQESAVASWGRNFESMAKHGGIQTDGTNIKVREGISLDDDPRNDVIDENPVGVDMQTPIHKPPLGVMPKYIWREKRIEQLSDAITRYVKTKMPVSLEWVTEFNDLIVK